MAKRIRKIPPVCFCTGIIRLLDGSLKISKEHVGAEFMNKQGNVFRIFRNILSLKETSSPETIVFMVSFKFSHLSHKANRVASLIPMLHIAGFPGFIQKMYAVYEDSGFWQGIYEWKSKEHLEAFKNSLVYRMMKYRALPGSIHEEEFIEKQQSI